MAVSPEDPEFLKTYRELGETIRELSEQLATDIDEQRLTAGQIIEQQHVLTQLRWQRSDLMGQFLASQALRK